VPSLERPAIATDESDNSHAFSRAQIELVATKFSEHNKCFYRTTAHAFQLRESGKMSSQNYNLNGAIDPRVESGVEHSVELGSFASAITGKSVAALDAVRKVLLEAAGGAALVKAIADRCKCSVLDGSANAIGVRLDGMLVRPPADMRELLGINAYPSAANTLG